MTLTKKLLVKNIKVKLKVFNNFVKKHKTSLLIQNKFPRLNHNKKKFLNNISDEINISKKNKNKEYKLKEKVRILKNNIESIKLYKNEEDKTKDFFNHIEEIIDIEGYNILQELFNKNKDIIPFDLHFGLIIPCSLDYELSCYLFRKVEFKGVFRKHLDFKKTPSSQYDNIIKKKTTRKSAISFKDSNRFKISNGDKFLVDKTNIMGEEEDEDWKKDKLNFMTIHRFILTSLAWEKNESALIMNSNKKKFDFFQRNNELNPLLRKTMHISKRKIMGIERLSDSNNEISTININRSALRQKTISLFKRPSLNLGYSAKKRKKKKRFHISILKKKQFFYRKNKINNVNRESIFMFEENENMDNKNKDEINSKLILDQAQEIDDIYYGLTLLIAEGKDYLFRKYFNLYEKIIDINFPIYEGNTLLIMSTKEGNAGITKFLCENKADVNLKNDEGNTALHYAIGQKFYKIVDILTIFGAREDILNNKGLTPWDCNK